MKLINLIIRYRKHPLFTSGSLLVFLTIVVNILSFVFQILISRNGAVSDVGLFNLVNSLNYLTLIPFNAISATIGYLVAYNIGKFGTAEGYTVFAKAKSKAIKASIPLAVVWLLLTPILSNFFHLDQLLPISSFVVVWVAGLFIVIDRAYLSGLLNFGLLGIISFVDMVVKLIGAYLLITFGASKYLYLLIPISTLFTFAATYISLKFASKKITNTSSTKAEVKFPTGIFVATIVSTVSMTLYMSLDIILAKHYLTAIEAGQYSIVAVFGKTTFFLGALVSQFIQPIAARAKGKDVKYSMVLWVSSAITFVLCLLFISTYELIGSRVMIALLGPERGSFANIYLPIYLIGMTGFTMTRIFETFYAVAGKYSFSAVSLILGVLQIIFIIIFHNDVSQFVNITCIMGLLSFLISLLLQAFYKRHIFITKIINSNYLRYFGLYKLVAAKINFAKSTNFVLGFFVLFCSIIIVLSVRGIQGNPSEQNLNDKKWTFNGPLELSPERGRFALMYSLVENKSFQFSLPIARFAVPDLGYNNKKFVSLFAPALSFIIIPGYMLGKLFGLSQVGAYLVIGVFGVLNSLLIALIVLALNGRKPAALIAALAYLFATPSFAYSVSLYQHQATVFIILLSLFYICKYPNKIITHIIVWVLYGIGISLDYPNAIIMMPLVVYLISKIFSADHVKKVMSINVISGLAIFSIIIPLTFFFWTNYSSYGNALQLAGTVRQIGEIDLKGNPLEKTISGKPQNVRDLEKLTNKKDASNFFATRKMLNGLYILLLSPDRGVVWYAPVIIIGIFGVFLMSKKHLDFSRLVFGIAAITVLLYSMWGDPWGGWAFGARYLIPLYSVSAIATGYLMSQKTKMWLWIPVFLVLFIYGVRVNTVGALTSSLNPPQVEVLQLEKISGTVQKYTYERNFDLLKTGFVKSYIFQTYMNKYFTAEQYYILISSHIIFLGFLLTLSLLPAKTWIRNILPKSS